MATVTTSQAEQLLAGRVICPRCGAALLASSPQCRYCKQLLAAPAAAATPMETPTVFEVVVYGKPITQGSMKRGRGGGLVHSNEALHPWRQAIEDALREKYWHPGWEPITQAVSADLIVTVPRPKSAPKNAVTYPTSHSTGDSDKYPRAVCDAASPKPPSSKSGVGLGLIKNGPNANRPHFRLLADDSLVVEWGTGPVKTFPRPHHTHQGALGEPGIRVRFTVLGDPEPLSDHPGHGPG